MNKRIFIKLLATILVLMLTFSNAVMIVAYAVGEGLENQQTNIARTQVEFDAYFKNERGAIHSIVSDINADNNLYLRIKLEEGILKNANISIQDSNFKLKEFSDNQGIIQGVDFTNNIIYLNEINAGTDKVIEIPIEAKKDNIISADYFIKESNVVLAGEYVNNSGNQVNINKEIKVLLQLHGETELSIEQSIDKYVPFSVGSIKGNLLQSTVLAGIQNNNLPIQQITVNIDVPVINNVKPSIVSVVGKEFTYNQETGKLTIVENNNIENEQIVWNKDGLNKYKIIYIYEENAYTENAVVSGQNIEATVKAYNDVETIVNNSLTESIQLVQKISDNVSNKVLTNKQEIYKGFIYNNSQHETEYQTTWITDIAYSNIVNEITLTEDGDKYTYDSVSGVNNVPNNAYYKSTYINEDNFKNILGENGYIDIFDENGNKIVTVNKDSYKDENNNFVITYNNEVNKITIKTSKPIENVLGKELVIRHNKAIKNPTGYELNWLNAFYQIETSLNQEKAIMNLREIETKIEGACNKNTLSTAVANNVEFTVALRTDSEKYQLYKNPVIEIKLPNYVQNVELGNVDILYGNNELSVAGQTVYVDNEGNKIIRVTLNGEQTEYSLNSANMGTNLFVSANITTNRFMASQDAIIQITCVNGKDNTVATSNLNMKFVSETGILMANSISNYNGNAVVTSLKGDNKVGNIEMNTQSKDATMNISLINNEKTNISGASILGRIPFKNNKTIGGQNLTSTFTTQLKSLINTNGCNANIYYSENGEADNNLQNEANGWTNQANSNSKSYLIVLNDEFKKGQMINFDYEITIPENLQTNEAVYSNYAVCYNNQAFEAPIIGVATTQTMVEEHRNQLEEQNIDITDAIQQNTSRGEDLVTITMQHLNEAEIDSSKIGLNYEYTYIIKVKNNTYHNLDFVRVVDVLSDKIQYEGCNIISKDRNGNVVLRNDLMGVYDQGNHNITLDIPELELKEEITLQIRVKAIGYSSQIVNNCIVTNDDIYKTQSYSIPMKSPAIVSASLSGSEVSEEIKEGQRIKYTILANNSGEDNAYVKVLEDFPEELKLLKATYYVDNEEFVIENFTDNKLELSGIPILPGRGIKIDVEAKVEELSEDILEKEIESFAIITGTNINFKTNTVRYTIKNSQKPEEDPTEIINKSISGRIWIDENKNGKRDSLENGLSNISVKLLNESGDIVGQTLTNNIGEYKFDNLNSGIYIVMFEHDSKLYRVTTYKGDDVIESLNSDGKETTFDGKKVAMTDSIKLQNSSITNIDLGLIKNSIFDLKLDKYIEEITVQNDQGVTTYNYTDENFAKVELVAKYIPSTTVILKYKIVVTNEGDVSGYAKQIVDYLPQDLKFSSELNKDWYINTDGNLYTASLADIIINPGETKEVELLVTKKMNENNTGLVANQAEIAESYNEQGIEDNDSNELNKNQNEDDISTASVIIGVKTGRVVLYLTITLICIAVIAVGSYVINKKVLRGIK